MPIECVAYSDEAEFVETRFSTRAFDEVIAAVASRSSDHEFRYIVTPNVDHIVRLDTIEDTVIRAQFRAAYDEAWMRLCDSRIIVRLAAWRSLTLPLAAGSDLTAELFGRVIRPGDRIAIIGGREDTVKTLEASFPGAQYVQHIPPMGVIRNDHAMGEATDFIRQARARFTFIAIGAPQAEILAHRTAKLGSAMGIGLCVGASIDFLTGHQQRAPRWMQDSGLEWAHRLASQPRRLWRRYLIEAPRIFWLVARWHPASPLPPNQR